MGAPRNITISLKQAHTMTANRACDRIWGVRGDGNCLFHAIILASESKNLLATSGLTHASLRADAVALVRSDEEGFLVPFDVYTCDEPRSVWANRMAEDGVFGDKQAIVACCILLDVAIRVKQGELTLERLGDPSLFGTRNELVLQLRDQHYMVERWAADATGKADEARAEAELKAERAEATMKALIEAQVLEDTRVAMLEAQMLERAIAASKVQKAVENTRAAAKAKKAQKALEQARAVAMTVSSDQVVADTIAWDLAVAESLAWDLAMKVSRA